LFTQIERNGSKCLLACPYGEEILVQTGFAVPVEQTSCPLHTVATDEHVPALIVTQQCRDTGFVDCDVDGMEPTERFFSNVTRLRLAVDADIAAQAPKPCEPRDKQNRCNRPGKLQQFCH
jgi:hypothetical protein